MPLFLFWYILRDLLKILFIATTVLVIVISFGAAITPLSKGLIGPVRLLVFILLAIPPMLQFALPFSAAFSATIVYHRMAQDNELAACAAAGVPYSNLLMPAATLGVVLTIFLSFLSNYISPRFWEAMSLTAHLDAPEFFVRAIERGDPIEAGDLVIYARSVEKIELPEDSGAYAALRVYGLVVASLKGGDIRAVGSAPQGVFHLTRAGDDTIVTSAFDELTIFNDENNDLLRTEGSRFPPRVIPATFKNKPKFMDLSELQQIVQAPEKYWRVSDKIDAFRKWLIKRRLYLLIDEQLRESGRVTLYGRGSALDASEGVRLEIYANELMGHTPNAWPVRPNPHTGTIRIVRYDDETPSREYTARRLTLRPGLDSLFVEPIVDLELEEFVVRGLQTNVQTARNKQTLRAYHLDLPISGAIRQLSVVELKDLAHEFKDDELVIPLIAAIDSAIKNVGREIIAHINDRTALSVSCLVMMLLGSTLAILLRGSLPLIVYFGSFVPAILGLILISAGGEVVRNLEYPAEIGLVFTWSGNLAMAGFTLIAFRRISRS